MVGGFLGFRVAGEGEAGELEIGIDFGAIGGGDREVDEVLLGIGGGGALSPSYCEG